MKQYRITTENIPQPSDNDAVLSPDDPLHELKTIQYLAGLGATARLAEYKAHQIEINKGSNISVTAMEKVDLMKKHDIKPGTPDWFKLWFSLPFMTNEKPIDK